MVEPKSLQGSNGHQFLAFTLVSAAVSHLFGGNSATLVNLLLRIAGVLNWPERDSEIQGHKQLSFHLSIRFRKRLGVEKSEHRHAQGAGSS